MKTIITTLMLIVALSGAKAQVRTAQPKIYYSTTQKILKGTLANSSEQIVHHKVKISVLLNKFDFVYPNKEMKNISVTMTQSEWKEGVKEEDYVISSHPTVSEIYFARDVNKIWLSFKDGTTIIYTLGSSK